MENRNYYDETIDRIEPEIAAIDARAYYASAAISLRRIADVMERRETLWGHVRFMALVVFVLSIIPCAVMFRAMFFH